MTTLEAIPTELGLEESWEQQGSSKWISSPAIDVHKLTGIMCKNQARFITITAIQLADDEGIMLDYHWDLDGQLLTFEVPAVNNQVASIFDLCEAADWIEREIHEHYAVEFTGREYEPLLLRAGDKLGVNLREEDE